MSKSNLNHVMMRIRGSDISSPIAVFRCNQPNMLDAVFAATVKTQQMLDHPDLIGVYNGTMNMDQVKRELAEQL